MRTREQIDPELHLLRSVCRSTENRARNDLETARFGIYAAFEAQEAGDAARWCKALRAALLVSEINEQAKTMALEALGTIENAI